MRRDVWRHGNDMQMLLAHPRHELPIADIVEPPQKGLVGLSAKLRQKVGYLGGSILEQGEIIQHILIFTT